MNRLKNIFLINLLLCGCGFVSAQEMDKKERQVFVYQVTYKDLSYENVKGIALYEGQLYYQPNDSLLMTYKGLSKDAKLYNNIDALKLFESLDLDSLSKLKDYKSCECSVITRNEYIIKIIEKCIVKEFVFTEVLCCKPTSSCLFIENLHSIFDETK